MPTSTDPLDLSDDDFAELGDAGLDEMVAAAEAQAQADADADDAGDVDTDDSVDDENDNDTTDEDDNDELPGGDDEETADDETDDESVLDGADEDLGDEIPGDDKDAKDDETKDKDKDKDKTKEGDEDDADNADDKDDAAKEVDYKAQVEAIMAPFIANGREMQIDSVEDVISLMQMGANYNKKMAGLKPNLKMLKMLENNELLSEDKLSYLIDLSKKDPTAINKLIKESGVNPLEIDVEKEHGYETNKTYTVSDNEVNLDGILSDIKDTESFSQTIDIVSNKWDAQSRQVLLDNPEVIKSINDHVGNGIYEQIMSVVEQERMLGRLDGMSDLESYKHVGDSIQAAGGFNFDEQGNGDADELSETEDANKTEKKVDPNTKARKKAAGSTKTTVRKPKKKAEDYDPLNMSDEDFEKLSASGLFK